MLCLLIILVLWIMYSYRFFAPRTTQSVAQLFTLVFLAAFVAIMMINLLTVICRYKRKGKLCTRTNCSFIWVTFVVLAVTLGVGSKIATKRIEVDRDLSQDCSDWL